MIERNSENPGGNSGDSGTPRSRIAAAKQRARERLAAEWEGFKRPRVFLLVGLLVVVLIGMWAFWPRDDQSTPHSSDRTSGFRSSHVSGETPPTYPAAAMENTEAGARAAVEYYYEALNYAQRSLKTGLDTGPLEQVADTSCRPCLGTLDWLKEISAKKSYIEGGEYNVAFSSIQALPQVDGTNEWLLKISVTRKGFTGFLDDGRAKTQKQASKKEGFVGVAHRDGRLQVVSLTEKVRSRASFLLVFTGAALALFSLVPMISPAYGDPEVSDISTDSHFGIVATNSSSGSTNSSAPIGGSTSYPRTWTEYNGLCDPEYAPPGTFLSCNDGSTCPNGETAYAAVTFSQQSPEDQRIRDRAEIICRALNPQDIRGTLEQEIYRHRPTVGKPRTLLENGDRHRYWSLVNAHTVVWSETTTYESPSILLGANVTLRLTPETFIWDFGDGTTRRTSTGGKPDTSAAAFTMGQHGKDPSSAGYITHQFRHTIGTGNSCEPYPVTVSAVWRGEYSVNGGAWQPLAPRITTTSEALPLAIYQAQGQLIRPDLKPNADPGHRFECPTG